MFGVFFKPKSKTLFLSVEHFYKKIQNFVEKKEVDLKDAIIIIWSCSFQCKIFGNIWKKKRRWFFVVKKIIWFLFCEKLMFLIQERENKEPLRKLNSTSLIQKPYTCEWSYKIRTDSLPIKKRGRHDRMIVGFTTTNAISADHHWRCGFVSRSRRGVQHYVIKFVSDLRQVCGFSPGPPVSSTDITEILLKVALSTIKPNQTHSKKQWQHKHVDKYNNRFNEWSYKKHTDLLQLKKTTKKQWQHQHVDTVFYGR